MNRATIKTQRAVGFSPRGSANSENAAPHERPRKLKLAARKTFPIRLRWATPTVLLTMLLATVAFASHDDGGTSSEFAPRDVSAVSSGALHRCKTQRYITLPRRGQMRIAQQFTAGSDCRIENASPVGTTERSAVPTGLYSFHGRSNPSDESLGYSQESLRDTMVLASPAALAKREDGFANTPPAPVRFEYIDVYVDSGTAPLAAYQFELEDATASIKIVGIEGGEHQAFATPPYYDPKALKNNRVIIAALSTADDLPTGKTRVATVHILVPADAEPEITINLTVAGDVEGNETDAEASFVYSGEEE